MFLSALAVPLQNADEKERWKDAILRLSTEAAANPPAATARGFSLRLSGSRSSFSPVESLTPDLGKRRKHSGNTN